MKKLIILLAALAIVAGCGSYEELVIQQVDKEYEGNPNYVKRVDENYTYLILKEEKADEVNGQIKQRVTLVVLQTGDKKIKGVDSVKFIFDRWRKSDGPFQSRLIMEVDLSVKDTEIRNILVDTIGQIHTPAATTRHTIKLEPDHPQMVKTLSGIGKDIECIIDMIRILFHDRCHNRGSGKSHVIFCRMLLSFFGPLFQVFKFNQ